MWSKSFRFIKGRQPRKSLTQNIKRRSIAERGAAFLCAEFGFENAHDNQGAVLDGRKTSLDIGDFVSTIDRAWPGASLSSSCGLAVLADLEKAARA